MSRNFESPALLYKLYQQVDVLLSTAKEQLLTATDEVLLRQPAPKKWSVALKFSPGDTFRFVIAHEQRHMAQALRAKN